MVSATHSVSQINTHEDTQEDRIAGNSAEKKVAFPPLFACVLVLPRDSEPFMEILQKLTANITSPDPLKAPIIHSPAQTRELQDTWLDHNKAAEYLRISKSTLYRYAEQERLESRKLGRRLEYRRSSLDKFKDQHVRRARRSLRARGIIPSAPNSGK